MAEDILEDFKSGGAGSLPFEEYAGFIDALTSCRLLREPKHLMPLNFDGHPFAEIRKCSAKTDRSIYDLNSQSRITQDLSNLKTSVAQSVSRTPACSSKSRERFADHVGAQITAKFVSQNPKQFENKQGKEVLAQYAISSCRFGDFDGRRYPSSNQRIASFLQYPEIRRVLGCQGLRTPADCPIELSGK